MAGTPGHSGGRPLPTALRILRGNPGKRALNATEPKPKMPPRTPSPPAELSDTAKAEWRRTGRKLLAAGLMTDLDVAQFAAYCASYARWLEATALLAKTPMLTRNSHGDLGVSPLLRVVRDAQAQYTRALLEFGMSPSSRSRVHAPPPVEADPFSETFGRA